MIQSQQLQRMEICYSVHQCMCNAQQWENLFFSEKWLMGWSSQHSHPSWEHLHYSHERMKAISTFFGVGKMSHPDFRTKICWKLHHDTLQQVTLSKISQLWCNRNLEEFCRWASKWYLSCIQSKNWKISLSKDRPELRRLVPLAILKMD